MQDLKFRIKTNILAVEIPDISVKEPMSREKLTPVLAVLKSKDHKDGFDKARRMVEFHGLGHSCAIHTKTKDLVDEYGLMIKAIRVIWNSPSTFGGIGNVYNSFTPSLTLGCGSYGGNSLGDNISALNLLNIKKVGETSK